MSEAERNQILLQLARGAIADHLGLTVAIPDTSAPWLQEPGATFVTLTQQGQLRGCIGSLEAHQPLWQDVRANAVASAFRDPRFLPLTLEELERTRVEVSLLSPQQAMQFGSEAEALAQLRPNVDGVVLQYGHHRGTFLPQVWAQLPTPEEFMAHLKLKAGLPVQFWADDIQLSRYTVQKWKEPA
jgi:AmmeMemoRadiSam system protein A